MPEIPLNFLITVGGTACIIALGEAGVSSQEGRKIDSLLMLAGALVLFLLTVSLIVWELFSSA